MDSSIGTVYPEYHVALSGESIKIHCDSAAEPRWTRNGNLLTVFGALLIQNITKKTSGNYTCHGYLDAYKTIPFQATATILLAGIWLN